MSGPFVWESSEWMWNGGITVCLLIKFDNWFCALGFCEYSEKLHPLIKWLFLSSYFRLLPCVTEHLTAEIVQLTVSDITRAIEWMKCSYLYVRMKKVCASADLFQIIIWILLFIEISFLNFKRKSRILRIIYWNKGLQVNRKKGTCKVLIACASLIFVFSSADKCIF